MAGTCTIPDVAKPPCDDFGEFLSSLRKARRVSARALSGRLSLSETYIYKWEHRQTRVNRTVLGRVADELDVTGPERARLFALADRRDAPESAKHLYRSVADPDANLLHALLEIDHDWPSEPDDPNPNSERARLLIDAAAWALARAAFRTGILPPYLGIRWPMPLVRLGIVPDVGDSDDAIDIPEALVREEMPFVNQLGKPESVTPRDAWSQSIGMARVYRRLLFSELDRARAATRLLQSWSYDRAQPLADCLSLKFRETDLNERFGVVDVGCDTVSLVGQRSLALALWIRGNDLPLDKPPAAWRCEYEANDAMVLHTILWANPQYLANASYVHAQELRDALLTVRSPCWPWVAHSLIDWRGGSHEPDEELERQIGEGRIDDEVRQGLQAQPLRLGVVSQTKLLAYLRSFEHFIPPLSDEALATGERPGSAKGRTHTARSTKKKPSKAGIKKTPKANRKR